MPIQTKDPEVVLQRVDTTPYLQSHENMKAHSPTLTAEQSRSLIYHQMCDARLLIHLPRLSFSSKSSRTLAYTCRCSGKVRNDADNCWPTRKRETVHSQLCQHGHFPMELEARVQHFEICAHLAEFHRHLAEFHRLSDQNDASGRGGHRGIVLPAPTREARQNNQARFPNDGGGKRERERRQASVPRASTIEVPSERLAAYTFHECWGGRPRNPLRSLS